MNRRDFLKTTGALAGAQLLPTNAVPAACQLPTPRGMPIALMNTFIDWYFGWSPATTGKAPLPWSPDAVKTILDRHAAAGNKTVYWRTTDGGDAMYWSKLCRVSHGPTTDETRQNYGPEVTEKFKQYDFGKFDVFRTAVDYGHELGMRVLAWFECDNEDHGLGPSEFIVKHPQFARVWWDHSVVPWGLSLAFPEVVDYKIGMAREMMAYGCDGIFLDLARGAYSRPINDGSAALWGYEEPLVKRYRDRTGCDAFGVDPGEPAWVDVRAECFTGMIRALGRMMRAEFPGKELVLYVSGKGRSVGWVQTEERKRNPKNPKILSPTLTDPYKGAFIDLSTYAREGLCDAICTHVWPKDFDQIRQQHDWAKPLIGDRCRYYAEFYGFGSSAEHLLEVCKRVKDLGCDGMVISEDGAFELGNTWKALKLANERRGT
ncbi:MAG: family 10 glycosylhydrolase [Planctomycetia bacterium]|nr:family 10 glycosylhydrolase [Planctomycetia bacterium]